MEAVKCLYILLEFAMHWRGAVGNVCKVVNQQFREEMEMWRNRDFLLVRVEVCTEMDLSKILGTKDRKIAILKLIKKT